MPEAPWALPQRLSGTERGLPSAKGSPGSGRLAARFSHRADFVLPPLPYASDALEPAIDATTMTLHHDSHHAADVANLNAQIQA
jgi:hypothetical protein